VGILFLTFWILLSYLVPLSLFVTMEIVKFVLARAQAPRPHVPPLRRLQADWAHAAHGCPRDA